MNKIQNNAKFQRAAGALLVVLNLIAFNVLSGRHFFRVDLTETGIYTLSEDTRRILGEVDDLVTVKYFITSDLPPGYGFLREGTLDLLEEFRVAAGGNVQVVVLDPGGDEEARGEAERYGLQQITLPQYGSEGYEVKMAFMGLAVLFEDRTEVVPVASPTNLEYELLMRIVRVLDENPPIVAFYQAYTEGAARLPDGLEALKADRPKRERHSLSGDYAAVLGQLRKQYRIEVTNLKDKVPDRVDTLVVANRENLDDVGLYHLDQFIMRGGKLVLLWPGMELNRRRAKAKPVEKKWDDWLAHYGITVHKNMVMDPSCFFVRFEGMAGFRNVRFFPALRITEERIDRSTPATQGIQDLALPYSSAITLEPSDSVRSLVLARSSDQAWAEEEAFPLDPDRITPPGAGALGSFDLAGLLEGEFISYYAVRKAPEAILKGHKGEAGWENYPPGMKLRSTKTAILVVGSSDFIGTPLPYMEETVYYYTLQFFGNAVDYVTTGEGFSGIRTRQRSVRYVDREVMDDPSAVRSLKLAGTLGGAAAVALFGLILFVTRRALQRREIKL